MKNIAEQHLKDGRHASVSRENRRVPSLRFHKASGQCYVVLSSKAIYCGKPDDPATERRYHQAIAEWLAAGQQPIADPTTITIKELLARFWTYAEQYYRTLTDGRTRGARTQAFRTSPRGPRTRTLRTPVAGQGHPAQENGRPRTTARLKNVRMSRCCYLRLRRSIARPPRASSDSVAGSGVYVNPMLSMRIALA